MNALLCENHILEPSKTEVPQPCLMCEVQRLKFIIEMTLSSRDWAYALSEGYEPPTHGNSEQ